MAIGRISGPMLFNNLERQGVDLAFQSNLLYLDVNNLRVGIINASPQYALDSSGNAKLANIIIQGNTISSNTGVVNFGSNSTITISGGSNKSILSTDGSGNLRWSSLSELSSTVESLYVENFSTGNAVISGGYISSLSNITATTGNVSSWYATTLNSSSANVSGPLYATSLNTANAVITGGYVNNLANLTAITTQTTNFSTGNAVINGGYINDLANLTVTTAQFTNLSSGNVVLSGGYITRLANANAAVGTFAILNSSSGNISGPLFATSLNTANAVITGGYIDSLTNITVTTATITTGNVDTLNTTTGNITDLTGTSVNVGYTTTTELNSTIANIITGDINALNTTTGNITNLSGSTVNVAETTTTNLNSTNGNIITGNIDTLNTTTANITTGNIDALNSTTGNITELTGTTINVASITTETLNNTYANIITGDVNTLNTVTGNITELTGTTVNVASITTTTLNNTYANITTGDINALNTTTGNITTLGVDTATVTTLNNTFGNITTAEIITGNVNQLNTVTGNVTNLYAESFSSPNVLITSGTLENVDISGSGNISIAGNIFAGWLRGNVDGRIGNFSQVVNVTSLYAGGNSYITSGGAQLQNVKISANTISSTSGDLIIAADKTDANHVVRFDSISALKLPTGTYAERPGDPDIGYLRYNTDIGTMEWWTGYSWGTSVNTITSEMLYPNGISNVLTLGQVASTDGILVNINGTIQQAGIAYIVNLNQITFAETPLVTDIIEIRYLAAGVAAANYYGGDVGGNVHILATDQSTSITTGALVVDGGVGIAKDVHVAGTIYGTVVGTIEVAGGINGTVIGNTNPESGGFTTLRTTSGITTGGNIIPTANVVYTLGNTDHRFKELWLAGSTIYLGAATISEVNGVVNLPAGSTVGGTAVDDTLTQINSVLDLLDSNAASQASAINNLLGNAASQGSTLNSINANIGAFYIYANANIGTLHLESDSISSNLGAYQTYANANIAAIQTNLGAYQTYANANVVTIQANLGAYQTYANANATALVTSINTINANLGAYQTYANANVVAIQANLGAYQIWSNANASTQATSINTVNANVGAYQVWANANVTALRTSIDSLRTNANTNTAAYLAGTISVGNITATGTTVLQGNVQITGEGEFITNNLIVGGNLFIKGNTTTIDSIKVTTNDLAYIAAANAGTAAAADGAGLITPYSALIFKNATTSWQSNVSITPSANLTYNLGGSSNYWGTVFSGNVVSNSQVINSAIVSTSATTGALVVTGGVGIGGSIWTTNTGDISANIGQIYVNISQLGTYANSKIGTNTNSNLVVVATTTSSNIATGALVVAGGVGISGNLNLGANVYISGNILPIGANVTYNLGSTTQWWNTFYGVSTQAKYADLAENYTSDSDYTPGTVVVFGGSAEITTTTQDHDSRIAGVISTNPAYLMNAAVAGLPVALQGRTPCRVIGPVNKGDLLVSSHLAGVAQKLDKSRFEHGCVVGKSLENIDSSEIKLIEVVVGLR